MERSGSLLDRYRTYRESKKNERVEELFKSYTKLTTMREYKNAVSLINENDGVHVNTKGENGYIDIEYHNKVGEYKAKLLTQLMDNHQEFYQYFLKRKKKIVITNEQKKNVDDEIIFDNQPTSNFVLDLLKQLFTPLEYEEYFSVIYKKIVKSETLLEESDCLSYLKEIILEGDRKSGKIDNFKYLQLLKGHLMNRNYFYKNAIVEFAFQYHDYSSLEDYMNGMNKEVIEQHMFQVIHQVYGLSLLNESLSYQREVLNRYAKVEGNSFFLQNVSSFHVLFREQVPAIESKFQNVIFRQKEDPISLEQILNLVVEFLQLIDDTNGLVEEFKTNVENEKILLWNPNDLSIWKDMHTHYSSKFPIEDAICYSNYDDHNRITELIANVPLTYTLEDVITIIHEFFHFHSKCVCPYRNKSSVIEEFPSIYFEQLGIEFLKKKGYSEEQLPINFRIMDTIVNFGIVEPSLNCFDRYLKVGEVDVSFLKQTLFIRKQQIIDAGIQEGLMDEEIINRMKFEGFIDNDEEMLVHKLIYRLNCILLRENDGILGRSPYLLGTVMAKNAMENGVSPQEILNVSNVLSKIEDPCDIMDVIGMDASKYQFVRMHSEMENVFSVTK